MMYGYSKEDKKMAVINITCDYPFEYRVAELSRWSGLGKEQIRNLVELLNLDVKVGLGRHEYYGLKIPYPLKDYVNYKPVKKELLTIQ